MKILDKIKNIIIPKEDDAHEFKPILAEIEDRPLNPLGNTIFWLIIIFMVLAALWMYFGKVDIVITDRGQIIPGGEEKLVQSLDKGVVKSINVKEGDYVNEGEIVAIVAPAEHEPGLELNNIREEEAKIVQQLASDRSKLSIASANKNRLEAVKDIFSLAIAQTEYLTSLPISLANIQN